MNKDLIIRQLCEDVADLKRRVAAMPVVVSPYQPSQMFLVIDKGNIITPSAQDGIIHVGTQINSVPSAYNPNVTSSFIDGIGRARLVRDGAIDLTNYVLVCSDVRSLWQSSLLQNDAISTTGTAQIAVSGGGFVTVYIPV